jgi:hypothetical protein
VQACTYTLEGPGAGVSVAGGGELEVAGRLGQAELVEDLTLALRRAGSLGNASCGGCEGDQLHPVEFVADVAPGVTDLVLDGADQ